MSSHAIKSPQSSNGSATRGPTDLLKSAKTGETEKLGELLEVYVNYLKILATTQLDAKLRHRVSPSDIVQETLLEAHRDFPQFRGQSEPELLAWLRRILIHNISRVVERHVLAEKRNVRREVSLERVHRSMERSSVNLRQIEDDGNSPSTAAQIGEHTRMLADHLAELAEDHRQVIILRNLEGLPFKEVAESMGRSSGAVRMLWLRAIDELRSKFRQSGML